MLYTDMFFQKKMWLNEANNIMKTRLGNLIIRQNIQITKINSSILATLLKDDRNQEY